MHTTQWLLSNGVQPHCIHVVEINPLTYQKMQEKTLGVNLYFGNVADRIDTVVSTLDLEDARLSVIYMDFMGGHPCIKILEQVLASCRHLISDDATLAVTLSARTGSKGVTAKKTVDILEKEISGALNHDVSLAACIGYAKNEGDPSSRSSPMIFAKFIIKNRSGIPIIPEYRPSEIKKHRILGQDIISKSKGKAPAHINADAYYDLIIWCLYPNEADWTWEPHGTVVKRDCPSL